MSTINPWSFHINGVISTDKTVIQNLETLCNATGAWLTFDYSVGKWSFVLNKTGNSVASFNDSNIVGAITVNGTGLTELYNSVRVEFPHIDLNDEPDYIIVQIPNEDRFPGEEDNELQIQYDILNDPVQAQRLAMIELKQSRMDKVIQFQTDYTAIGLKAGDLIDVTNSVYGFVNKVFRIVTIEEVDSDGGSIDLAITALEYDANVYSTDDLYRYARYNSNGIMSIGAIGQPGIPVVTKYENDSRPRIEIETTVNNGIVNGMEFWYYSIPAGELPGWQTVDDATRVYTLYDTVRPTSDVDSVFATGESVILNLEGFDPGNFLVKVRAVNDTTSSVFSDLSGLVEYTPTQIPDAIKDGSTTLLNSSGGSLATALGIATLVNKVGAAFGSNASQSLSQATTAQAAAAGQQYMICDSGGSVTVNNLAPNNSTYTQMHSVTFTASQTCVYKFDMLLDQNESGAKGGRGAIWGEPEDIVGVLARLYETSNMSTILNSTGSGGPGAQYWTDFALTMGYNLTAGTSYTVTFGYFLLTESAPTATASFDIGWNFYSVRPI